MSFLLIKTLQWLPRTVKSLRSDFILQVDKLAYYYFMDADRRHKTPGSKTRILLLTAWQAAWASAYL